MPVAAARRSRAELHERLEERLAEIEQTILTRARSLADPDETGDPAYVEGLRDAVIAGLRYGLSGIEGARPSEQPIPPELVNQARLAARNGVSLDIVLRRYFAGYTLLGDFVIAEAKRGLLDGEEFHRLVRTQGELFDRLIAVVSEEHRAEAERKAPLTQQRKVECVEKLLAGELVDASELDYALEGWHVGVVGVGTDAAEAIQALTESLGRRLLSVCGERGIVWAWIGGRASFGARELSRLSKPARESGSRLAIGEPGEDLAGWRLTHRQAVATMPVAAQSPEQVVRYRDAALLASIATDDLLDASFHRLYLAPLEGGRDKGAQLREALEAYFAADRNVSAAAATLGASRNTVSGRLAAVEQRLGRPLASCATDLEVALRLERLKQAPAETPTEQFPANAPRF